MAGEIKLKNLSKNGQPPETRLEGAFETCAIVDQLIEANEKRSSVDSQVAGLIDGNPPYVQAELDTNNMSWRCNTNWRIAEAFLNIALSMYWDIVSESPSKATCVTEWGESEGQAQDFSGVITEEFERLNKRDSSLDNMFRDSQRDMVLYRMGPVMWQDAFDFRAKPIRCSDLLTLDQTSSDLNDWKLAVVRSEYSADELYSFIRNAKSAQLSGWNVEFAKKILMDGIMLSDYPNKQQNWEWYQERIRNNDIYWSMKAEVIPVAHVLVKEFAKPGEYEGRVSHFMVVEGVSNPDYLFQNIGRFENWRQIICPFYYDTGDGKHHSVKGLGIKAYGALSQINRLMCHEVDLAYIGSAFNFQFKSAADKEAMQMMQIGPVNYWPEGTNLLQSNNTGQLIQAPSFIRKDILSTVTANLSQYRQGMERDKGNPITAREVDWRSENQSFIGRSALTFYFSQSDDFYAERFRRAANPNITEKNCGGREALEFQKRCKDRGVPMEALQKVTSVTATRTVGYGSPDARMQSMMRLLARLPLYGEAGREKILEDLTAMDVGYTNMRRYIPETKTSNSVEFQKSQAQDKVALLRLNIIPMVTSDQNPIIYAQTFIQAAAEAMAGLQQGAGNPAEVVAFVDNCGHAAALHLERIKDDVTRKQAYEVLMDQLEALGKNNDQLKQMIQKQAQQNGQQQQKTQAAMSDEALKTAKTQSDIARKNQKTQVDIQLKTAKTSHAMQLQTAKTRQDLAAKDITTAQDVQLKRLKAVNSNGSE